MLVSGCGGQGEAGTPVEFNQLYFGPRQTKAELCTPDATDKRFSVVGYVHYPTDGTLVSNEHLILHLSEKNSVEGAAEGRTFPFLAKEKSFFGGIVDGPVMHDAEEKDSISLSGRTMTTTTTGWVDDAELKVHLVGGGVANSSTRVRLTFKLLAGAAGCSYYLERAEKA